MTRSAPLCLVCRHSTFRIYSWEKKRLAWCRASLPDGVEFQQLYRRPMPARIGMAVIDKHGGIDNWLEKIASGKLVTPIWSYDGQVRHDATYAEDMRRWYDYSVIYRLSLAYYRTHDGAKIRWTTTCEDFDRKKKK